MGGKKRGTKGGECPGQESERKAKKKEKMNRTNFRKGKGKKRRLQMTGRNVHAVLLRKGGSPFEGNGGSGKGECVGRDEDYYVGKKKKEKLTCLRDEKLTD